MNFGGQKRAMAMVATTLALSCVAPKKAKALSISAYGAESSGITADGSTFDGSGYTCACSPIFPMHSLVEVCYLPNDACVVVYTNDSSGSYDTFDVSREAAEALGIWGTVGRCFAGSDCTVQQVA